MAKLVKVLLAEGHRPSNDAICCEIKSMPAVELIGTTRSAHDLIRWLDLAGELPDMVIMDVDIDVKHSFWCIRKLASRYPELTVIVLAASDESLIIGKMIDLGADGYILKEKCSEGLHLLLGRQQIPQITCINLEYTCTTEHSHPEQDRLDQKEKAVLRLVMNQYSSMEISEELSMECGEINETMDRLTRKTNSSNPLDLKRYAIRHAIY